GAAEFAMIPRHCAAPRIGPGFVFVCRFDRCSDRAGRDRIVVGRSLWALGFVFRSALGFVRARQRLLAEQAQFLQAAADLAALLRLVAADGVEAADVECGERVGLLPLEAAMRWADLGGGVE